MTTTTKTLALAAAFIVPFFAAVSVQANNISDYNDGAETVDDDISAPPNITRVWSSANDYCNAVDNDGPGGAIPNGDDDSCDNNDTDTVSTVNGPGDPTGLVGLFFPNCVDGPDNPTTVAQDARTDCDNGTFGIADDNGGDGSDGRFGGDYPNATEVEISVAVGQVAIVVQAGYRDPWATTGGTTNPTVFTGISTTVCIGLGVTYKVKVGGGGTQAATDPPAGQTIVSYFIGRVLTIGTCGGTPGGNTPKTIIGAWTYLTQVNDSTVAAAVTVTADVGTPTCTITFANSASVYTAGGEGRWGAVGSSIMIGPSNQYGNFQSDGPKYGAASPPGGWAGTVLVKAVHTQVVSWAVWAWSIEGNYTVVFGFKDCINSFTPFSEPACLIIVVAGVAQAPTPTCRPAATVCGPNAPASPEAAPLMTGFDCVGLPPFDCATKVVNTVVDGVGGHARARVWCDENLNGVRDDNPPWEETKAVTDITGVARDKFDLVQGIKTSGDYHCTMVWEPTFTGDLLCFDHP